MAVSFSQDLSRAFPSGLARRVDAEAAYAKALARLRPALERVRAERDTGSMPHWTLPDSIEDLEVLSPLAERLRLQFQDVVVLATGGSSLGGRALRGLLDGQASGEGVARLRFCDNLDPESMDRLLGNLDLGRTAFLVISKSGSTGETMAQALVCLNVLRTRTDLAPKDHFLVVVEPGDSPLRRFAANHDIEILDHDTALGGRYAVLSLVGMLPAMILGLDAEEVRAGAAEVLNHALADRDPEEIPAAAGAALSVALQQVCGVGISVLMPYSDRLDAFALWYRQLWAESLGKRGLGMTPIRALGPVDQHSQLQLYLEGPADKQFTLICPEYRGKGPQVTARDAKEVGVGYLSGITVGDFVSAQQDATADTLAARGRSTRVLRIGEPNERTLGGLFVHFMLETVLTADLLGVHPFDQPAVEEGKELARGYLRERVSR